MALARLNRSLALFFPPLVVLASAHNLYLANQQELGRTLSVLVPFWTSAVAAVLLGALLRRAERVPGMRVALWTYYTAGIAFLCWGFLRALPLQAYLVRWILDTAAGTVGFGIIWGAALVVAVRRSQPRLVEPALALLAVVLAAREAVVIPSRLDTRPLPPARDLAAEIGPTAAGALPNVYHLLLDSLQDEMLEPCLPEGAADVLDGFVRHRMTMPADSTRYVLPLILTGRWPTRDSSPGHENAFLTGATSLLQMLRRGGYRTVAIVPRYIYAESPSAVDVMAFHDENARDVDTSALHAAALRQLWLYSILPLALSEPLARGNVLGLDAESLRNAALLRAATFADPVQSRVSMERLIELEPRLPGRGRYTLVHLLLPHRPHILASDFSASGASSRTDLKQQTDCTLLLVTRFLDTLRTLGRLDGSIVLIHGDHGAGETFIAGKLVPSPSIRFRTALLFKPAGAHGALRRGTREAQAIDVAPTLVALSGLRVMRTFDGVDLDEVAPRGAGPPGPE